MKEYLRLLWILPYVFIIGAIRWCDWLLHRYFAISLEKAIAEPGRRQRDLQMPQNFYGILLSRKPPYRGRRPSSIPPPETNTDSEHTPDLPPNECFLSTRFEDRLDHSRSALLLVPKRFSYTMVSQAFPILYGGTYEHVCPAIVRGILCAQQKKDYAFISNIQWIKIRKGIVIKTFPVPSHI